MYTIEQLSMITGLTSRTLRNYLGTGILQGSRESGIWQFSEEQVEKILQDPSARSSIRAKQNAIVYDFLAGQDGIENEMCILLDRTVDRERAGKLSDFFCRQAERFSRFRFSYSYEGNKARFILKGEEESLKTILGEFYDRESSGKNLHEGVDSQQ